MNMLQSGIVWRDVYVQHPEIFIFENVLMPGLIAYLHLRLNGEWDQYQKKEGFVFHFPDFNYRYRNKNIVRWHAATEMKPVVACLFFVPSAFA